MQDLLKQKMALATELITENERLNDEVDLLRSKVTDMEAELGQEQAARKAAEAQLSRLSRQKGSQEGNRCSWLHDGDE